MKILITLTMLLSSVSAFASQRTVTCSLKNEAHSAQVEFTYFDGKLAELLETAAKNKTPLEIILKIDGAAEVPAQLQVEYFGFEPNMYKATTGILADTSVLKLTYDVWAAPVLVVELLKSGVALVSEKCTVVTLP